MRAHWYHFGNSVAEFIRLAQSAGDVSTEPLTIMVPKVLLILGDMSFAVFPLGVFQDFFSSVIGEVHINIGRGRAIGGSGIFQKRARIFIGSTLVMPKTKETTEPILNLWCWSLSLTSGEIYNAYHYQKIRGITLELMTSSSYSNLCLTSPLASSLPNIFNNPAWRFLPDTLPVFCFLPVRLGKPICPSLI